MSCQDLSSLNSSPPSLMSQMSTTESESDPPLDSFIADLLQCVTSDDSEICGSCDDGVTATSKCGDCSELLCEPCVHAHLRVRLTKDHKITRFNHTSTSSLVSNHRSLSSSSRATNSPCSTGSLFCEVHHEQVKLYCEDCVYPTCAECAVVEHLGHHLIFINDAIENAKNINFKLISETRSAMFAIRDAMSQVQRVSECVEIRSHQAVKDVHKTIRRYIHMVEERERELFIRIERQRVFKSKALIAQMDGLRVAMGKLTRTNDILNECQETGNGMDIIFANERAESELKQLRSLRGNLHPCEDDMIVYNPPDDHQLMQAAANLGTISNLMPPIGRSRDIREVRVNEVIQPTFAPTIDIKIERSESSSVAIGRPIFGATKPVIVRDNGVKPSVTFGIEGEEEGYLCRPWGVCCDKNGNILVADRSNNRVQIFNSDGTYRYKFGTQGTGPGQFDRPAGLAVDSMDRIIVADKDNHRVQVFTMEGVFVLMFGEKGCRPGQFNYPWDVAANSLGQIVVSDTRNHRVQLFNSDGKYLAKYGFEGMNSLWKNFDSPRGVCFNNNGSVIATDFNNHRLVIIEPDFSHAKFLGGEGTGLKQFLRPQGIVCDDEGRIVVADSRNNRIQVFQSNGAFLWTVGRAGTGDGEMDRPSGICISPDGRIIVVDFGNNRVQIF